mgnify:CR=1 FL=1
MEWQWRCVGCHAGADPAIFFQIITYLRYTHEIFTYLRYIDESLITYLSRNCSQIVTSRQKSGSWRFGNENVPVSILEEKRRPVSKLEWWRIGYQHICWIPLGHHPSSRTECKNSSSAGTGKKWHPSASTRMVPKWGTTYKWFTICKDLCKLHLTCVKLHIFFLPKQKNVHLHNVKKLLKLRILKKDSVA